MPEQHRGENIVQKIQDCVSEFGLRGKVQCCVHDNVRNMESSSDLYPQLLGLGCIAHTLLQCIKPSLEINQVSKIVGKRRKLVGHFKHSTTLTGEMRKLQTLLQVPEPELIQVVCTRWNLMQLMLKRLCKQQRVITDILVDNKITQKSNRNSASMPILAQLLDPRYKHLWFMTADQRKAAEENLES